MVGRKYRVDGNKGSWEVYNHTTGTTVKTLSTREEARENARKRNGKLKR